MVFGLGKYGGLFKLSYKKKKTTFTRVDEITEYVKLGVLILIALGYLYVLYT